MSTEQPWYYSQTGKQQGPVSGTKLRQLAQDGTLQPTDLLWKEGLKSWRPASELKGLVFAPPIPPPLSKTPDLELQEADENVLQSVKVGDGFSESGGDFTTSQTPKKSWWGNNRTSNKNHASSSCTQRISKRNSFGERISAAAMVEQITATYQRQGWIVNNTGSDLHITRNGNFSDQQVTGAFDGQIRIGQIAEAWVVKVKGTCEWHDNKGSGALVIFILGFFFWPLWFLLLGAGTDEIKVNNAIQDAFAAPLQQLRVEVGC
jgi:hypothetical protein